MKQVKLDMQKWRNKAQSIQPNTGLTLAAFTPFLPTLVQRQKKIRDWSSPPPLGVTIFLDHRTPTTQTPLPRHHKHCLILIPVIATYLMENTNSHSSGNTQYSPL